MNQRIQLAGGADKWSSTEEVKVTQILQQKMGVLHFTPKCTRLKQALSNSFLFPSLVMWKVLTDSPGN